MVANAPTFEILQGELISFSQLIYSIHNVTGFNISICPIVQNRLKSISRQLQKKINQSKIVVKRYIDMAICYQMTLSWLRCAAGRPCHLSSLNNE